MKMFDYSVNVQKLQDSIEEERTNRYESSDPYRDDDPQAIEFIAFEDTLCPQPE